MRSTRAMRSTGCDVLHVSSASRGQGNGGLTTDGMQTAHRDEIRRKVVQVAAIYDENAHAAELAEPGRERAELVVGDVELFESCAEGELGR